MKKFLVVLVSVIMLMSVFTMTACGGDEIIYDAGEYGELTYTLEGSVDGVKAKEGYRFLGWGEPVQEGKKTIKKAQYEHIEYYLNEVKDIYVCEQGPQYGPYVISKITNLQTEKETEQVVDLREVASIEYYGSDSAKLEDSPIMTDYKDNVCCFFAPKQPYEFDVTANVTIENPAYNTVADFELRFVRNRIPAESISVSAWSANGENIVSKDKPCRIDVTVTPNDASFKECEYRLLTISRDGHDLDEEMIKEIAYFDLPYLQITDKAKAGDLIYVQVINKRDPQVKSDIIEITVY